MYSHAHSLYVPHGQNLQPNLLKDLYQPSNMGLSLTDCKISFSQIFSNTNGYM